MSIASLALLLVLGTDPPATPSATGVATTPRELTCLAQYYKLRPAFENGTWVGVLPSGARLIFDDGRAKTFDQRLADPDLEDTFIIPYHPGPIREVEAENEDPGRVRVESLLAETYGNPPTPPDLVRVRFVGMPIRVHKAIAPALGRVADRIARAQASTPGLDRFLRRLSGGFATRTIAGTDRLSAHAFGIAIDLDSSMADYWRWQKNKPLRWRNRIPQAIVDAFEAEGFIWGGRWYHYDTMHFEYRPEFFGPSCGVSDSSGIRSR